MTLPANIRVNTSASFPATVKGGGAIAIAKNAGIWTVSLNLAALALVQTVSDPVNTYVLIFNPVTGVMQNLALGAAVSASKVTTKLGGVGQPASPYAAQPNDDVLLVYAVPFTVTVDWAGRVKPLRIVDQTAAASVVTPISVTPKVGQTQMATVNYTYQIVGGGGSITLTPLPDGTGAY